MRYGTAAPWGRTWGPAWYTAALVSDDREHSVLWMSVWLRWVVDDIFGRVRLMEVLRVEVHGFVASLPFGSLFLHFGKKLLFIVLRCTKELVDSKRINIYRD